MLAVVALIAAPAALANGDTINATATVQFSGAVDNPASCNAVGGSPTAMIDWGDGTADTTGTISASTSISGTHTYAATGTYEGSVTITGRNCNGGDGATDIVHGERRRAAAAVHGVPGGVRRHRMPVPDSGQQRD